MIVYVPFASPLNVNEPVESVDTVPDPPPESVMFTPETAGVTDPETLNVGVVAVKFCPVTFAPLTVTFIEPGENVVPLWLGVTV